MRIYCIFLEDYIFHPIYLHRLAQHLRDQIVGVSIVTRGARKPDLLRDLKELCAIFGVWYFFLLSLQRLLYVLLDLCCRFLHLHGTLSLEAVARLHHIPSIKTNNINASEHLRYVKEFHPDVIVSSAGQIFGDELLRIPTITAVNRHSALLPKYAGVWPVVRAIQFDEKKTGVTIHTMIKKIDAGNILAQRVLLLSTKDSLVALYAKLFRLSVDVTIEAIDVLRKGGRGQPMDERTRSYFSYLTRKEGALVRKKIPIIRWNEFFLRG